MDSYNIAVKHLQDHYGKDMGYTNIFNAKLSNAGTKAKKQVLIDNHTSRDKLIIIQKDMISKDNPDYLTLILVEQFYYGVTVKKELENHLLSRGIN